MIWPKAFLRPALQPAPWSSLGLCFAMAGLGVFTFAYLEQPRDAAFILLTACALSFACTLDLPSRPDLTLIGLALALGVSLAVAHHVNGERLESYWGSFGLWLAGLLALVAVAYREALPSFRVAAPAWLRLNRGEVAVVAALTAFAFCVRVVDVASIPAPFSGDEAGHLLQGLRVSDGELRNMFQSGLQGQPTAYYFQISALTRIFGVDVFGARMVGVLIGTALVPAVYIMLRQLWDRRVGLSGAVWLCAYHLALHFSRQDLNNIGDPLVLALTAFFVWRAVIANQASDYIMAGLIAGLGLYVNVGCRIAAPFIAFVYVAALILQRDASGQRLMGGLYMAGAFLAAAGPLALFWYQHPNEFMDRLHVVGIYESGWMEREMARTGRGELSILASQFRLAFGAFGYYTDRSPHYEGPMPFIEYPALPFFLLGIAVSLRRLAEVRYLLVLALFAGVVISGGVLTIDAPNSQRILGTMPASAAFVAVGLVATAGLLSRFLSSSRAFAVTGLVVAALAGFNLWYYFHDYARGGYFSDYNTRVVTDAAAYARRLPPGTVIYWYGAPDIYVGHPAFKFGTRNLPVFDVLDTGEIEPVPRFIPGQAALLVLPHRKPELDRVLQTCPGGSIESRKDSHGQLMYYVYRLAGDAAACLRSTHLGDFAH